jgi:hypothetical protein
MSSVIYKFACPLCGVAVEAKSVNMEQTHEPDHTLVHVRIHDGGRVIHECDRSNRSAAPRVLAVPQ